VALPILPHSDFGADCCGCLVEIVGEESEFVCNECGVVVPLPDVQRAVMEMESTEATCPHCGRVNQISGFSEIDAFVCRFCGRGVNLTS
jgi:Zn finger protein HypA/HybF involved in hydrogenase expression